MKENNRSQRTKLMEEGDIKKTLLTLAIPTIIATLISAIYNFVDTLFVGMLNDTAAMGAVSIAFPLFMIISALGQMLGVGSASHVSRSLGQGNKKEADKTATTALFLAIVISIVVTILVIIFLKPIFILMGASETIIGPSLEYSRWLILGSIFTIINMTLNNLIRAEGNAKYSMNALIIGAVLNIIFDPIFMFTFGLKLKGAAIATVLGQAISTIYLLSYYMKKNSYVNIEKNLISKNKATYIEIFKIGLPVFFMQFLSSIAFGIQNAATSTYGDDALAAVGTTLKINMIPLYIMMGYNQGFQPFAAYNYGAKNLDRVKEGLKISTIWIMSFGFIFTILFCMLPEPFIKLFTKDPQVIAYGINNLIAFNIFTPLVGFTLIHTGLFQSLGKGIQSAILSIVRQGLFLIPTLIILPKLFIRYGSNLSFLTKLLPNSMNYGLYGIMYAQPLADLMSFILTGLLAISLNKEFK
ncbi:MATE family efflux transporter [Tissierella sp. MSJ-40]|uniref:Multidrug export protein MepA n=1 Tax=Tissierella simiarum TaxID=2841534 RepID=A0ABS6E4H4_9FIRM|nr:MATE family efflux transporter [Tissierella simiarum]MBU5437350.1 MATE family efflux transporter [Tissierella simiarum]